MKYSIETHIETPIQEGHMHNVQNNLINECPILHTTLYQSKRLKKYDKMKKKHMYNYKVSDRSYLYYV